MSDLNKLIEALIGLNPDAILFEPRRIWDKALVGITCRPIDRWDRKGSGSWVAVYDFEAAVTLHAEECDEGVSGDEFITQIEQATEFVMCNAVGSWLGPNTPTWTKSPDDMVLVEDLSSAKSEIGNLKSLLASARIHVWRQQNHGKHEQDRADATEWLSEWGET